MYDLRDNITVWGGVSFNKFKKVLNVQKHCLRIFFSVPKKRIYHLDKFRTSARRRPVNEQVFGQEFFDLDHSKPLFYQHGILTVGNQYNYHITLSTFKILLYPNISLFLLYIVPGKRNIAALSKCVRNLYLY